MKKTIMSAASSARRFVAGAFTGKTINAETGVVEHNATVARPRTFTGYLAALVALAALVLGFNPTLYAQSSGPTELPVDPSFLYTSLDSAVIPAITVVLGFSALFIVIRWIRKAMSKG